MFEKYGIAFAMTFKNNFIAGITFTNGELTSPAENTRLYEKLNILNKSINPETRYKTSSGYINYADEIHIVSLSPFMKEADESARPDKAILVIGKKINQDFLNKISSDHKLPSLAFSPSARKEKSNIPLIDVQNNLLGYINWTTPTPSSHILSQLLLIVIGVSIFIALITWRIICRETGIRREYASQLYQLASKDFLTGISNRREFYLLAGRELSRARRTDNSVGLLHIDLDFFKKINDNYGHKTGDQVLVHICRVIEKNLRDFDLFARFGGEEFIILLPNVTSTEAWQISERIRQLAASSPLPREDNKSIEFTLSIGIACWDGKEDLESLIHRSDLALYKAKENGRNRSTMTPECG